MKKGLFTGALLFLVLFALGAFLFGAPAFDTGEIVAAQTLDFRSVDQVDQIGIADQIPAESESPFLFTISIRQAHGPGQSAIVKKLYYVKANPGLSIPETLNRQRGFDILKFC